MSGLVVRPMTEEDVPAAARLEQICFAQPWSVRSLLAAVLEEKAVFLVAELDGQTAGYAGMHTVLDEGYIDNVAVFPQCRGQGVAGRLVAALVEAGRQRRLSFLTLEVRPSNRAALRLYEKFGFVPAGRRPRFYENPSEDALLLTRF